MRSTIRDWMVWAREWMVVAAVLVAGCGGAGGEEEVDAAPGGPEIRNAVATLEAEYPCFGEQCQDSQVDFFVYNGGETELEVDRLRLRVLDCEVPCVQEVDSASPAIGGEPLFCEDPWIVAPGEIVSLWLRWEELDFDGYSTTTWSCPPMSFAGANGCTCNEEAPPAGTFAELEVHFAGIEEPTTTRVVF